MPRYVTVGEAVDAGAQGSDSDVSAAIDAAELAVDKATGDLFAPQTLTVRALLAGGVALLPCRVRTVTSVSYADSPGSTLAVGSYAVSSSATRGDVDAIRLLGYDLFSADLLDVTYEPVRAQRDAERAVLVAGSFGWDTPPAAVRSAVLQLVRAYSASGTFDASRVNVEGDAELATPPRMPELVVTRDSPTGLPAVDELLRPYRRATLRVS